MTYDMYIYIYICTVYTVCGNMGIIQVPTPYLQRERERDRVRERKSENLVVSVLHVFFVCGTFTHQYAI